MNINPIRGDRMKKITEFEKKEYGQYSSNKSDKIQEEIEKYQNLLFKPHKTIRDTIHLDITLTRLEVNILDTMAFQRLHGLKQLGTTYLVYPSAKHTRFEHSLGTLKFSQKIIDLVNQNPYPDLFIGNHDRLLIRLSALLHDLAHIPFGHTLEDEGNLFLSQWKDNDRIDFFLGNKTDISKAIQDNEILKKLNNLGHPEYNPRKVINSLKEILMAIENKNMENLPKPFICDIVGNTLCADLLDYIRRDIYFTGLQENFDERLLSYLYLTNYNRKPRIVLRLIKPKTGKIRRDVLSGLLHLLRLRYSLAEKVYYHHTKVASSAMLISAVGDMLHFNKLKKEILYSMTDEQFLFFLGANGTDIAKKLINQILNRNLYKPVYGFGYSEEGTDDHWKKVSWITELRDPNKRWIIERNLERQNILNSGDLVIYCPGLGMGHKALETLTEIAPSKIGPLEDLAPERVKSEIRDSITRKHRELWTMYVLVNPKVDDTTKKNIAEDVYDHFGIANMFDEYHYPDHQPWWLRFENRFISQNTKIDRLSSEEVKALVEIKTRSGKESLVPTFEEYSEERMVER